MYKLYKALEYEAPFLSEFADLESAKAYAGELERNK